MKVKNDLSFLTSCITTGLFRVFIPALIGLAWVSCQQPDEPLPYLGIPQEMDNGQSEPHRIGTLRLIDHDGNPIDGLLKEDRVTVLNTFFTSCPTICPKMTDQIRTVQEHWSDSEQVAFYSISIDPVRDQPNRLRAFMDSREVPVDENWYFATGDRKEIYDFARYQLFLSAMQDTLEVTSDFIHSEKVVLVDDDGHIRGFYRGTDEVAMRGLKRDIGRLLRE